MLKWDFMWATMIRRIEQNNKGRYIGVLFLEQFSRVRGIVLAFSEHACIGMFPSRRETWLL